MGIMKVSDTYSQTEFEYVVLVFFCLDGFVFNPSRALET